MAKKLLFSVTKDDLVITFFSGHGPGGQNRNKCQNCCRIHHPDSGVTTTGQEQRDQKANLRAAFRRLGEHPKFKAWVSRRVYEIDQGRTIEEMVEETMRPDNLKVEVQEGDKWVVWKD